ncbi:RHS repeat protein, partial [Escherichia coli]|nr:RHS repeat protein [Escherichia coli]EFG8557460.1 RHS repeat protein [Escherichia coli]
QAKTQRRSLADTLQQSGGEDGGSVVFPPVLVQMLDRLESEILADRVSEESRRWRLSARKGQQNGAQNTMNGATC